MISMFQPTVSVSIHDERSQTIHTLRNSRFNFQRRDSFADLLARDSWETDWLDYFDGPLGLVFPNLTADGIPQTINVTIYASWWPAFCIIDFVQGQDYCQIATRPRTMIDARWLRRDVIQTPSIRPVPPPVPTIHHPEPDEESKEPDIEIPIEIDFARIDHPPKPLNRRKNAVFKFYAMVENAVAGFNGTTFKLVFGFS